MTWIADASIAMAWCFEDEVTPRTEKLLDQIATDPLIVPLHWSLEITNVLRNAIRRKRLTEHQAEQKVAVLMSLAVNVDVHTHILAYTNIYQLAQKYKLTTYDAAYLELAQRLAIPLATNDDELIKASRDCGVNLL